ncbi:hypothetical protein KUCAC02_029981, partial [Chaenocephalus aceratus]
TASLQVGGTRLRDFWPALPLSHDYKHAACGQSPALPADISPGDRVHLERNPAEHAAKDETWGRQAEVGPSCAKSPQHIYQRISIDKTERIRRAQEYVNPTTRSKTAGASRSK